MGIGTDRIEERKRSLLRAVVEEFIRTGRPVGSIQISATYAKFLSAPTVRNTMARLEEEGLLTHPHTSAGRVPTDKGYRSFVNSLSRIWESDPLEETAIRNELIERASDLEEILRYVPSVLAGMTGCTGFVVSPALLPDQIRRVEVMNLGRNRLLVVFVAESGFIRHRVVAFDGRYTREEAVRRAFEGAADRKLYVSGESNTLVAPDFSEEDQGRLLHLFSNRPALLETLVEELSDLPEDAIGVKIGSENQSPLLDDVSLVAARFSVSGTEPQGLLGVMGPKRMNYGRAVGVVRFLQKLLESIIGEAGGLSGGSESTFPGHELVRRF